MLGVRQQDEGSFASEASARGWGLQMCLNVGRVSFFFCLSVACHHRCRCFLNLGGNI